MYKSPGTLKVKWHLNKIKYVIARYEAIPDFTEPLCELNCTVGDCFVPRNDDALNKSEI